MVMVVGAFVIYIGMHNYFQAEDHAGLYLLEPSFQRNMQNQDKISLTQIKFDFIAFPFKRDLQKIRVQAVNIVTSQILNNASFLHNKYLQLLRPQLRLSDKDIWPCS